MRIICFFRDVLKCMLSLIIRIISIIVHRKDNILAFGSWGGEYYIDNSRYLLEKALTILGQEYLFVWIGNETVKDDLPNDSRIICCRKDSLKSIIFLLRSKYMFCSQFHFVDICSYNVYSGAIITYLHHGCPIKKWGDDQLYVKNRRNRFVEWRDKVMGVTRKIDYFVASSRAHHSTNLTSLKSWGCDDKNDLFTGTPRNDFILENMNCKMSFYKEKYSKLLNFDIHKNIILYVPTFRRGGVENQSLIYRDEQERACLSELLNEYNYVLIEKAHNVGKFNVNKEVVIDNMIQAPKNVNLQEMMLFTDCMISDYSGAFLDFSLLNRPIINYLYDYEYYRDKNSGLYYNVSEFAAGAVAYDFAQLLQELRKTLDNNSYYAEQRNKVSKFFMEYETGNASEKIINVVLNKKLKG